MSGFEVVGVVFGVLPLIITAIQEYERIIDPVITYRQYSKAVKTFMTELNVQRDIFQNECIWILSRFVDSHDLEDMLKEPSHSLRETILTDRILDHNVAKTIGPSYRQLQDVLELIKCSLDEIYEETKDLPEGLSRPPPPEAESIDLKAWRRHISQKMKLSFSKPSLNDKLGVLRHRNQAFLAISQQVVRFNVSWTPAQTQQDVLSTDRSLEKIQKLRTASKTLYQHLERLWSCPKHTEHSANLRLCLETSEIYMDASSKMLFDMALTYSDIDQSSLRSENMVLLAIESPILETSVDTKPRSMAVVRFDDEKPAPNDSEPPFIQRQKSIAHMQASKRSRFRRVLRVFRGGDGTEASASKKQTPLVAIKRPPEPAVKSPVRPQSEKLTGPDLADLDSATNLCMRILEASKLETKDKNVCIGYLTGSNADRYLVYSRQSASRKLGEIVSLSNVIGNRHRLQSLPKQEKWRLAGSLSLAVLLYHSTPWLRTTLNSDNILFFNAKDPEKPSSLEAPHLHSFGKYTGKTADHAVASKNTGVKNELLWALGVMLLEIEFEDTLERLVEKSKLDGVAQMDAPLAYHLPMLKRRAGEQLGTLYGRIVRMCLDCDFGLGLDEYRLDDPRVQQVFYSRIVRQFQERMPEYSRIWSD